MYTIGQVAKKFSISRSTFAIVLVNRIVITVNKPVCCPNTPARKIPRSIYEASRDIAREINKSKQFKKKSAAERKKVEMAFAHMKRNLNFQRLRLRGIKSVNDECVLVATVQNLRKLAKYRGQPPLKQRITTPEI